MLQIHCTEHQQSHGTVCHIQSMYWQVTVVGRRTGAIVRPTGRIRVSPDPPPPGLRQITRHTWGPLQQGMPLHAGWLPDMPMQQCATVTLAIVCIMMGPGGKANLAVREANWPSTEMHPSEEFPCQVLLWASEHWAVKLPPAS